MPLSQTFTLSETLQWYIMPDGSAAIIRQEMTYGDVVIILLLVALLFMQIYYLWNQARFIH